MEIESPSRRSGSCGRFAVGGCSVILLVAAFWWIIAQTPPAVRIPTPVMPNPNAFNTFQLAASQMLESKKIDNAATTPEAARRAGVPMLTLADREKLSAENAPALATLREGLDQQYMNPPSRSFNTLMPYFAKFRGLARFLAFDSALHSAKGDYRGAARSSIDSIAMGGQIPHGSTVIGGLVGVACQAIGRRPLWQLVDHLNAAQSTEAVRRLEKIRQNEFSEADILQEEKWAGQAGLMEFFRSKNPGNLFAMMSSSPQTPQNPAFNSAASSLFYLIYSKQRIMNDYTVFMDAEIKRARQPYRAKKGAEPKPLDPFVEILAPVSDGMIIRSQVNRSQNGLLETTIALRAYKLLHGAYPASLADLSPQIMKTQPTDPFASGQPFQYRRNGAAYILYSIGPDGKNDGGKAIDSGPIPGQTGNQRYRIEPESDGDIVAGKNLY
jgi:hypothetical protein